MNLLPQKNSSIIDLTANIEYIEKALADNSEYANERATAGKLEDVIHTEEYGDIEIYSQDAFAYFLQDKNPNY